MAQEEKLQKPKFLSNLKLAYKFLDRVYVNPTYSFQNTAKTYLQELKDAIQSLNMTNLLYAAIKGDQKYFDDYVETNSISPVQETRIMDAMARNLGLGEKLEALKNRPYGETVQLVFDEISRAYNHPDFDGSPKHGLDKYPEFEKLVDEIVGKAVTAINNKAHLVESELTYKRQFVLEAVVGKLSDLV